MRQRGKGKWNSGVFNMRMRRVSRGGRGHRVGVKRWIHVLKLVARTGGGLRFGRGKDEERERHDSVDYWGDVPVTSARPMVSDVVWPAIGADVIYGHG